MSDSLKQHLPTVVAVLLIGLATTAFALSRVLSSAGDISVEAFSAYIIAIPTIAMIVCSFVIMFTAQRVGRQLYLVVVATCFVLGIVSMVVTSAWMSDASVAAQLLEHSAEGTQVVPVLDNTVVVIRDIAAYIVAPTVGCILGVWIGSKMHPITSDKPRRKR